MSSVQAREDRERQFKKFWEVRAADYPLPFEEETYSNSKRIISLVKERGVVITKSRILDIGCGTGIYTLPLSFEASYVTGFDFSEAMLNRLIEQRDSNGIGNVDVVHSSWRDLDVQGEGFYKSFDIAWSSMSGAIREQEDIEKMESCARQWCVYIGWGRKRRNAFMEEVFKGHNLSYQPPPGAGKIKTILEGLKRHYSLDYIYTSWTWKGDIEKAVRNASAHIEVNGLEAKVELIREIAGCYLSGELVCHRTEAEIGLIVWRPL